MKVLADEGKGIAGFLVYLCLADKIQTVFNRVLDRDDIFVQQVYFSET